ncbi:MAG TPA: hypothetical protein VL326_34330 [Kofleriaceae bacterium]|nr:hypothetical protein [Kofleriaceae bacterium]
MIRILIALVVFTSVAHADTASDAKKVTDDAFKRFAALESDRGPMWKAWDLIDSSAWDNVKHSRDYVIERKGEIDKRLKNGENVDAELKLDELKRDVNELDQEIAAYRSSTGGNVWKLYGGAALFIVAVFGMSILRFLRSRVRR